MISTWIIQWFWTRGYKGKSYFDTSGNLPYRIYKMLLNSLGLEGTRGLFDLAWIKEEWKTGKALMLRVHKQTMCVTVTYTTCDYSGYISSFLCLSITEVGGQASKRRRFFYKRVCFDRLFFADCSVRSEVDRVYKSGHSVKRTSQIRKNW